jgi:WS/DGAT/MGAT family acyltransferase
MSRYARLSLADRSNLRIERVETPAHIAGLCVTEAGPLLREDGELDLATIRRRLERRLTRVPELRRVVRRPPPLCGPSLWVDDPAFSIDRHVNAARIDPPGDEASLLRTTDLLLRPLLPRSRPLWELWFLTGLAGGRLGALFKIHHAVADGLAAIALAASLLDLQPDAADPPPAAWSPAPAPSTLALLADSARCRATAAASTLGHPVRLALGLASALGDTARTLRTFTRAPRTSLNTLPGRSRQLRAVHLDLEQARTVAHAQGAKVNDVLLTVVAGGLRALLLTRGELTAGMELMVSVPAALRRAGAARELGNAVGAIVVPLPVYEPDAARRLERIAAATRAAKVAQHPAYVQDVMAGLAALGLALPLARRQRLVNTFVTNIPGPCDVLYLLGARIEAVLPVVAAAGNVTVIFAALSYRGRLDVVVGADTAACPDVDVLVSGMERAWASLTSGNPGLVAEGVGAQPEVHAFRVITRQPAGGSGSVP